MLRNFDSYITDVHGNVILDENREKVRLRLPIINALLAESEQDRVDGNEKLTRFKLAEKLVAGGDIDLSVEEIATIKKVVGKYLNATLVGRIYPLLDADKQTGG